ncbi:MAG: NADH-quinone oxidoreductase subunit NuoG [Pseudomonadota bacterium]
MSELRKIIIDGVEIEADPNLAVIQACELAGVEIPRFCYHERLSIAGNCRMCLVEPVGAPKPAASCHLQVRDLRGGRNGEPPEVLTNSPMVKKAREGVMEFLLLNHPLDCPICDQGGECDLQDQAMAYGVDASRFKEAKRSMDEIHLGPLIKTHMTRCIQCTRCVRFATEIAGVPELGCTGRGEDAEIISYLDQALTSELQGNVIDLCPVGALTSRPYAFTARPWELKKTESIDVMDALGANIRVDVRGREVMRILPREHADLNEEWLDDKQRFIWDGLRRQRLDKPYLRRSDGRLTPASWPEAFGAIARRLSTLRGEEIAAVAGDLAPVEAIYGLRELMRALGSPNLDCRQDGAATPVSAESGGAPAAVRFNPGVAAVEEADRILLIGVNPRLESPVLNARIRKSWLNGAEVRRIGAPADLTYDAPIVGAGPQTLANPPGELRNWLAAGARPLVILGAGALARPDGAAILRKSIELAEAAGALQAGWLGFAVLQSAASRLGGLATGFLPHQTETPGALSDAPSGRDTAGILAGAETGEIKAVYLLGADELPMERLGRAFVIYQGSHGDAGASRADVVLPSAAYTEENGLFLNMEARPQLAARAAFPPGDARENWAVLRALSAELGRTLPFNSLEQLRAAIFAEAPWIAASIGARPEPSWTPLPSDFGTGALSDAPFSDEGRDFYRSNPIARASVTMAELSKMMQERRAAVAAE